MNAKEWSSVMLIAEKYDCVEADLISGSASGEVIRLNIYPKEVNEEDKLHLESLGFIQYTDCFYIHV